MNENAEKRMNDDKVRRRMTAAAVREIHRREGVLSQLQQLDEGIITAALDTFESADGAAECSPAKVARSKKGRQRVLRLPGLHRARGFPLTPSTILVRITKIGAAPNAGFPAANWADVVPGEHLPMGNSCPLTMNSRVLSLRRFSPGSSSSPCVTYVTGCPNRG